LSGSIAILFMCISCLFCEQINGYGYGYGGKNVELFVCVCVCVRPIQVLDYRNNFIFTRYGKVYRPSCAPTINFLCMAPSGEIRKRQS